MVEKDDAAHGRYRGYVLYYAVLLVISLSLIIGFGSCMAEVLLSHRQHIQQYDQGP